MRTNLRKAVHAAAAFATAAFVFATLPVICATPVSAQNVPEAVERASDDLDVPYVPTPSAVLDAMFRFAKPGKDDFLIDLGSGDGRIVIAAAQKFGVRGFGVDLNKGLVEIATNRARQAGVGDRVQFLVRDLYDTDISRATILTMYLLPEVVLSLRERILRELKPGTRIVSHDYHLGGWRPDGAVVLPASRKEEESIIYHWIVPARLAGTWQWTIELPRYFNGPVAYSATLGQEFQDVLGDVEIDLSPVRIRGGLVAGKRVSFSVTGQIDERIVHHDFDGVVSGDTIDGTVRLSGGIVPVEIPWRARRSPGAD